VLISDTTVRARPAVRAELLALADVDGAALAHWRELVEQASEPNPFFDPDFVRPAAMAVGARVALLVARDDDGWTGCLPVQRAMRSRSWGYVPLRGLVAWTHRYGFLGTPLLRKGSETRAAQALVQAGRAHGILGFDLLRPEGPVADALRAADSLTTFAESDRAGLHRTADTLSGTSTHSGTGTWSLRMNGKRRRDLLRRRRRLSEAVGAEVETVDLAGDPAAVDRFLSLEASGWKAQKGTALRSDPAHTAFFQQVCDAFAARGCLQLLSLQAGGATYAMLCSLMASDTLFQFKIAFDERFARCAPGVQIEVDAVDMVGTAFPQVTVLDTCADPRNAMANALFPDRVRLQTAAVAGPGLRGRRDAALVQAALTTRNAIRRSR
jgi:CelD/BcsL family acetyltransferase involved in cellulose biosynthesis